MTYLQCVWLGFEVLIFTAENHRFDTKMDPKDFILGQKSNHMHLHTGTQTCTGTRC